MKLFDSTGHLILTKYCETDGECNFTGINKGFYRVVNRKYKIDTTFAMPLPYSPPEASEFIMFIDFDRCEFGARQAKKEIKQGKTRLLLISGNAPTLHLGQEKFEKQYHISYFDYGDMGSPAEACVARYNDVIFAYLDKKYGSAWRQDVRNDVIGLAGYIKMNPAK